MNNSNKLNNGSVIDKMTFPLLVHEGFKIHKGGSSIAYIDLQVRN